MSRPLDLHGKRFGRLVVKWRDDQNTVRGQTRWTCMCDCGKYATVRGTALTAGNTKSCGCLKREGSANRPKKESWLDEL